MRPRRTSSRLAAAACWLALAGCDQFASVGFASGDGGAGGSGGLDASMVPPLGGDASPDAADGATPDAGPACVAPVPAVCDPVKNTGCPGALMMQCAIDPNATSLAGYCIFLAPNTTVDCLNTGVTESCAPSSACLDGACRKLCFCNSDCDAGQCCSEFIGEYGYKVCGGC